jgi:hypothetical protein
MLDRKKIGDILIELQVLTAAEVDAVLFALRQRGDQTKFGQAARDMGLVRDEHILAALSVQMQLFPNAQTMSLRRLLGRLREPMAPRECANHQTARRPAPTTPTKAR